MYLILLENMGKCQFNETWVETWPWVKKTGDKHTARCALCLKDIDVAAMGEAALKESHKVQKRTFCEIE